MLVRFYFLDVRATKFKLVFFSTLEPLKVVHKDQALLLYYFLSILYWWKVFWTFILSGTSRFTIFINAQNTFLPEANTIFTSQLTLVICTRLLVHSLCLQFSSFFLALFFLTTTMEVSYFFVISSRIKWLNTSCSASC